MTERLWLGNKGSYQVVASYVCLFKDNKVKLRKENGSIIAVPLNLLCEDDIAFIATQSRHLSVELNSNKANGSLSIEHADLPFSAECQLGNTPSSPTSTLRCFSKAPENVKFRHMTLDESKKMLPTRSLSSITEQFKRQTFIENPWTDALNLAYLPRKVIGQVFNLLDVNSKAQLAVVSHRFYPFLSKPATWETLWFVQQQTVGDLFFHKLIAFLQYLGLHKSVKHIYLDKTNVTSESVLYAIKHLEGLETLSVQSCWKMFTFHLALGLTELAKNNTQSNCRLARVIIGKVLNRGLPPESKEPLDSKSFGQDIWIINSALNRITNKNVIFDVALCNSCHIGASAYEFICVSCGILPLLKCVGCAPKCDRCDNRSCQLPTCVAPDLKIEIFKCKRCDLPLALCSADSVHCQQAQKKCKNCQGLYHRRCRSKEGIYFSNQCTSCGEIACPYCELTVCGGKCNGQWCSSCVSDVGISPCRCILIFSEPENLHKKISKRNVCKQCQKPCTRCSARSLCDRCLYVHSEKCI